MYPQQQISRKRSVGLSSIDDINRWFEMGNQGTVKMPYWVIYSGKSMIYRNDDLSDFNESFDRLQDSLDALSRNGGTYSILIKKNVQNSGSSTMKTQFTLRSAYQQHQQQHNNINGIQGYNVPIDVEKIKADEREKVLNEKRIEALEDQIASNHTAQMTFFEKALDYLQSDNGAKIGQAVISRILPQPQAQPAIGLSGFTEDIQAPQPQPRQQQHKQENNVFDYGEKEIAFLDKIRGLTGPEKFHNAIDKLSALMDVNPSLIQNL